MTLGAGAAAIVGNSIEQNSIDPRPVLIVTGLVQEARIAAGPGMIVICSSSDPQQLRALLATLDSSTFRGVISFGVAGGLDPSLKSGDVVVVDEFKLSSPKTREFVGVLSALKVEGTTLVVASDRDKNLTLASRNVPQVELATSDSLNTYQVLRFDKLLFTRGAFEKVEQRLAG